MTQTANNPAAYIWSLADLLRCDFPKAVDDAVMDSNEAHRNQMMQLLSDPSKAAGFARVVLDLLKMAD